MIKKMVKFISLIIILLVGYLCFFIPINNELKEQEIIKPLTFKLSKKHLKQGEYIEITFDNIDNHNLKIETNLVSPNDYEIYIEDDKGYAFIPIAITIPKGTYSLKILDDDKLIQDYEIIIEEDNFEIQRLTINESIFKETHNSEAERLYQEAMKKARGYNLGKRLYEDVFIVPTQGRITTEFGIKRYVNNNKYPSRHYGIDIANKRGTPIKAIASGIVTYAGFFPSGGNYIVIDHGLGLLSYYAHLDSFAVKELDVVKQGQIIGYMGTTGFSTGYHLHFAISFKKVFINPWLFISKDEIKIE